MTLQPKNEPIQLYDAQGRVLSTELERHARAFTLQFLHHTISGAALTSELIEGRVIGRHEMPLVATPTADEIRRYERGVDLDPSTQTFNLDQHRDDMVERRFTSNHVRLLNRGALKETIEVQRQAMMLATEHALDAVLHKDQQGFNEAQRDIDTVISLGSQMIMPLMREAGVPMDARAGLIAEIHEEALTGAIRSRRSQLDEHDAQELTERWEEYAHGYKELKKKGKADENDMDLEAYMSEKPRPYTARVSLSGRDLMKSYAASVEVGNDNERSR